MCLRFPASDDSSLQQLHVLLGRRVVEQVCANETKWRFSMFGAAQLRVANELRLPQPVFQPLSDTSRR